MPADRRLKSKPPVKSGRRTPVQSSSVSFAATSTSSGNTDFPTYFPDQERRDDSALEKEKFRGTDIASEHTTFPTHFPDQRPRRGDRYGLEKVKQKNNPTRSRSAARACRNPDEEDTHQASLTGSIQSVATISTRNFPSEGHSQNEDSDHNRAEEGITRTQHDPDIEVLPHAMRVSESSTGDNRDNVTGSLIAVATKGALAGIDWKSRRVRTFFFLLIAVFCVVVGAVVVAVVTTRNSSNSSPELPTDDTNPPQATSAPTSSPSNTAAPTTLLVEQIGESLFDESYNTVPGPRGERYFGWTVDMTSDGNRIVSTLPYCPCAYIYDYLDDRWMKTGTVTDGPGVIDHVAISGNGKVVAIGSPFNEMGGKVVVFEDTGKDWKRMGQPILGQSSVDHIGGFFDDNNQFNERDSLSEGSYDSRTIAFSEDGLIMAVGSSRGNYVRIFQYDVTNGLWTTLGENDLLFGQDGGDEFGTSLDLSADGKRIIVGSPDNRGNGSGNPEVFVRKGQVRVYDFQDETKSWVKIGQDINGATGSDLFGLQLGSSVSISADGSTIAVGSNLHAESEDVGGLGIGDDGNAKVYRYSEQRDEWIQIGNTVNVFQFGLGLDHDVLLELDHVFASEKFPINTRISGDGKRLAISVPTESLKARFTDRGVVRLHELRGDIWEVVGSPIQGSEPYDHSGRSIALSFNGTRLAIGSPKHNGRGSDQGQVRVFDLKGVPERTVPTLAPSVVGTSGEQVSLTLSLNFTWASQWGNSWSLHCGGVLSSSGEVDHDNITNVKETIVVAKRAACNLRLQDVDAEYLIVLQHEMEPSRQVLLEGTHTEDSMNVPFVATDSIVSVTVALKLDDFPEEVGWSMKCNDIVYQDVIAGVFLWRKNDLYVENIRAIEQGALCEVNIIDKFGDGICCDENGEAGFFEIYLGNEELLDERNLLVRRSGLFGTKDTFTFTASPSEAVITSSPTGTAASGPPLTFPPSQAPLTFRPNTAFPSLPPTSLTPITIVFDFPYGDAELIGWRLSCEHVLVAERHQGTYTIDGVSHIETAMVKEGGRCVFLVNALSPDLFYDFGIYYGSVVSDSEELQLTDENVGDDLRFFSFEVSPAAVVVGTDNPSAAPMTPPPTLPPGVDKMAIFQAEWYDLNDANSACAKPQQGTAVSCGVNGKIEILNTTEMTDCSYLDDHSIKCSSLRLPQGKEEFLAVVYGCRGSNTSAWTTRVVAIPDHSVQCNGGAAGARLVVGQSYRHSHDGSTYRSFPKFQCIPARSRSNRRSCGISTSCPNNGGGGGCVLHTLDLVAYIPEEETCVDETCLFDNPPTETTLVDQML